MQGIKIDSGEELAQTIKCITQAGVPVVGHVGLTPQRQHALGGFRVQGKSTAAALQVLGDAQAVQEAVPAEIAAIVNKKLRVPTIGIGAGNRCSGQVLVQIDMLGNYPPGKFLPKFVKKYADLWGEAFNGIKQYRDEVRDRTYPDGEYTYAIPEDVVLKVGAIVDEEDHGTQLSALVVIDHVSLQLSGAVTAMRGVLFQRSRTPYLNRAPGKWHWV